MSGSPSDLDLLRSEHPGWTFTAVWVTAASGPDIRLLRAERETVRLTARDAADLARQIGMLERTGPWPA